MKTHVTDDALWLFGGALAGAAAMYLLDPDRGQRRRRQIVSRAEHVYGDARHLIEDRLDRASHKAQALAHEFEQRGSHMYDDASKYTHNMSDQAHGIAADLAGRATKVMNRGQDMAGDYQKSASKIGAVGSALLGRIAGRAKEAGDDAADRAQSWGNWASKRTNQASKQARSWLGKYQEPPPGHTTSILSSACGFMALGAGLMYFFHPTLGAGRRHWVASAVSNCVSRTGQMMRATGHDIAHRVRGAAYQAQSAAGEYANKAKIDASELVGRLREAVNTLKAEGVSFMADADGIVTVTGVYAREHIKDLLEKIEKVPGVSHIINRLEVRDDVHSSAAS